MYKRQLFALALWFLPTYLKMGTTTIPQLMEARFGRGTKLMFSFVIVVMYSILNLPVILDVYKRQIMYWVYSFEVVLNTMEML